MASLSAQIEEMEEELYGAQAQVRDYEEENSRLKDEVSDLEDQVAEHEAYIDWIDETYPEARIAYDAKQRLDEAA
jgi:chromosome segregation ATPase